MSGAQQFVLNLADEEATLSLGRRLSPLLKIGDFVALKGSLGAGKTTLARGIINASQRSGDEPVTSPTFTLVQIYQAGSVAFWHFDLYRIEAATELRELGLEEAMDEGVCLVEWPEKLGAGLPEHRLEIELTTRGDARQAVVTGWGGWGARLGDGTLLTGGGA